MLNNIAAHRCLFLLITPEHVLEPAYVLTLAPHESAIIRNQRARDELGIYVGDQNESEFPGISDITPGMNMIVQPLQIHVPPPDRGTNLFGLAYTLTKVDRDGNKHRTELANRRDAEPGGTFQPGKIRSLGVVKIKLVAAGTPSPNSNFEPAHLLAKPGTYLIYGSGGVSRPDTGSPTSGAIELVVGDEGDQK